MEGRAGLVEIWSDSSTKSRVFQLAGSVMEEFAEEVNRDLHGDAPRDWDLHLCG